MSRSLRIRLDALVRRASLDAQLVEGRNPRTSPELELRAAQLTEGAERRRLSAGFPGVACLWVLIEVARSLRAAWGFVADQHAKARPPQPGPLAPLPIRTREARRPASSRRAERRRLAA